MFSVPNCSVSEHWDAANFSRMIVTHCNLKDYELGDFSLHLTNLNGISPIVRENENL